MVPVPKELLDFIRNGTSFIVAGHEEPDGDCVGSQLALTSLLRRLGKKAVPCSAGPFKRTEIKPYEGRFLPCPTEKEGLRVIVMDCSLRERVGDLPIDGLLSAAVDHHASGNFWGTVSYLDPHAPAAALMTERIFRALGEEPTVEEAELLLFGLCTDTGFFRHLDETGTETFLAAARLTAAGASPKKAFAAIHGGKTLNSRILMGTALAKAKPYYGGRLLLSGTTLEESEQYGMESRDSDAIYQVLQSVEGVEAMALLRQENSEECTLGLRSRDRIDVAAIAKIFGGGGHKNAAGAKTSGTIAELEEKLTAAFAEWFN
ncbi:MAG: bifunctional oligoribonuclease/PAP phosphatase NrnA [Treponema sp.]|nr:bifunctional oligoribonuclease/PAP phosphatase NrnA [Treponema sp.]